MSGTRNKVILKGHTGDDVKMNYVDGGNSIGRFTIANKDAYTNKTTGQRKENTEWHNIVVRNKAAEICEKYLKKGDVQATVETFMEEVKTSLESGDNVYLRGFGSFVIKTRAEKTGRNISKNTTIKIPAHNIPAFKPARVFVDGVKSNVEVK